MPSGPNLLTALDEARAPRPRRAAAAVRDDSPAALPLGIRLILITVFLPEATSFFIAGLRLTPTRLLFLIMAPIVFFSLVQKLGSRRFVFIWSDLFVPLTSLWMFVGPAMTQGLGDSLTHSGPVVLEYLIGYLAPRVLLNRRGQARAFASLMCLTISVVAIDAVLDTITGRYITREITMQLTGYAKDIHLADEIRFGLLRAAGPLEHPILLGYTCVFGLLTAAWVRVSWRPFCILFCGLGVLIPFSSAPLQSAVMGLMLLVYGTLTARMRNRWLLLGSAAAMPIAIVLLAVPSPFGHLIEALTLDAATGYYRLLQWNLLGPIVMDNMLFGIDPSEIDAVYDGGTIDSLWLVLALWYGLPASVFAGVGMIAACSRTSRGRRGGPGDSASRFGTVLGVSIFLIIFAGMTVHFWGSTWILVGLLCGVRAHIGELAALDARASPPMKPHGL